MQTDKQKQTPVSQLKSHDDETGDLNVVIETPKGSRIKYKYDERSGMFKANHFMPEGMMFPFDFGFIPGTRGEDGDPLDILLLMDAPAFSGCLVNARLVGVIQADQKEEDGQTVRNDRLVAVAAESRIHSDVKSLAQLNKNLLDEIEHFFKSYTEMEGKEFKPRGRAGPERAKKIVEDGLKPARSKSGAKARAK